MAGALAAVAVAHDCAVAAQHDVAHVDRELEHRVERRRRAAQHAGETVARADSRHPVGEGAVRRTHRGAVGARTLLGFETERGDARRVEGEAARRVAQAVGRRGDVAVADGPAPALVHAAIAYAPRRDPVALAIVALRGR